LPAADPVPAGKVCGNELDHWFTDTILYPRLADPSTPKPPLHGPAASMLAQQGSIIGARPESMSNDYLRRLAVSGVITLLDGGARFWTKPDLLKVLSD
jgi:hypothetical protein